MVKYLINKISNKQQTNWTIRPIVQKSERPKTYRQKTYRPKTKDLLYTIPKDIKLLNKRPYKQLYLRLFLKRIQY